ncbi:MAG: type II toxin-antitoxin system HicA family toxin [Actinobacteria bacterium]|nr:MAG: type II toxin-antitoxin system HicA family toxin [Actinomycetota bacterium]
MGVTSRHLAQAPDRTYDREVPRRVLKEDGWTQAKDGKHNVKMTKPGRRPITLPHHGGKDYGKGLWAAILREAGLSRGALRVDEMKVLVPPAE